MGPRTCRRCACPPTQEDKQSWLQAPLCLQDRATSGGCISCLNNENSSPRPRGSLCQNENTVKSLPVPAKTEEAHYRVQLGTLEDTPREALRICRE